jgi:hypothetical protein
MKNPSNKVDQRFDDHQVYSKKGQERFSVKGDVSPILTDAPMYRHKKSTSNTNGPPSKMGYTLG